MPGTYVLSGARKVTLDALQAVVDEDTPETNHSSVQLVKCGWLRKDWSPTLNGTKLIARLTRNGYLEEPEEEE
jgi:hypothetical protein